MPSQSYRPRGADTYIALKSMTPPPWEWQGQPNPDAVAYWDELGRVTMEIIEQEGGTEWLQAYQLEGGASSSSDEVWLDESSDVQEVDEYVDEDVSDYQEFVSSDSLGLARGAGEDDSDLYAQGATSASTFLGGSGYNPHERTSNTNIRQLAGRKQLWIEACQQAGATRDETSVILAQLMQESFRGTGHDESKDGARDGSRNFSNLNLNEDMLYNYGGMGSHYGGSKAALNDDAQMVDVVQSALEVMRTYGVDRYLHFVRNGRSGFNNPDADAEAFAEAIREVAQQLAVDDDLSTNSDRSAHVIRHI